MHKGSDSPFKGAYFGAISVTQLEKLHPFFHTNYILSCQQKKKKTVSKNSSNCHIQHVQLCV